MLWSIIVGGLIGLIAGAITKKGVVQWDWIAKYLYGIIGSSVGQSLLGSWGPFIGWKWLLFRQSLVQIIVAVVSFLLGKISIT